MEGITERVAEIVCGQLGAEKDTATPSARIAEDLGADPLDFVEIVMKCEEEWDISISEAEADRAATVERLAELIERKIGR